VGMVKEGIKILLIMQIHSWISYKFLFGNFFRISLLFL